MAAPVPNPFLDSRDDDDRPIRVRVDCKCGRSVLAAGGRGPIDNCPRCGGESHRTMMVRPVDMF